MNDVVKRLMADMRARISPSGSKTAPSVRETASWGAFQIAWPTKLASGCSLMLLAMGGMAAMVHIQKFIGVVLTFPMLMGIPIAFGLSWLIQRSLDLKAYQKLLENNERFTLQEYSRLMSRQIELAQADLALGGPKEVARLTDLQSRIMQLIESGAGLAGQQPATALDQEADLAQSILETYQLGQDDGLKTLDARLPDELRSKLLEVDREAQTKQGKIHE